MSGAADAAARADSGPTRAALADVDVAVVGAGVVGSAIARELAGSALRVALIDARADVGDATSKANTAIWHTGFDAPPGTLESRLVTRGWGLLGDYAERTGIPLERTGALLVAWTDEQVAALDGLADKARANGIHDCEIVDRDAVYAAVGTLGPGALAGLTVPGEGIICTWSTTIALATDALARGAEFVRSARVTGVTVGAQATTLQTTRGPLDTRWVVNAAGLGADHLDAAFGYDRFHVTPRRGELIVYDKFARRLLDRIVLPVPTAKGKGVLVSPTVYGNVMVGPTSENLEDRADTSTSADGLDGLVAHTRRLLPQLAEEEITATYAGLRAATEHGDYVVDADAAQRYVCVGGIRSTGLTSSMALGEHVAGLLAEAGEPVEQRADLPDPPRLPPIGQQQRRRYADGPAIAADPAYGQIVCFCERVTLGEIRDALASPLPPVDVDGLRRRTRATMGRCQGFACAATVTDLLAARR